MNISTDPFHTYENLLHKNKVKSFSLYFVVLAVLVICIGLLPIIKVDVSTQGRGIVRSESEPVIINSMINARIDWINIKNNQLIKQGDTLVRLSLESINSDKENTQKILQEQRQILSDLERIQQRNFSSLQTPSLKEEYLAYQGSFNELSNRTEQAKVTLERNQKLFDKHVISKSEYETYLYSYNQSVNSLQNLKSKYFSDWNNRIIATRERITSLENTLSKLNTEEKNYIIKAPISGTIENFSGVQQGSFLLPSQSIATISPINDLIAEIYVAPKDIGLIQKNQEVKFQMDAFNYNQWGIITGKIIDIDKNVSQNNGDFFFKVRCALNNKTLSLKNGYKAEITKGMTLTARFIINRRSLYELLFDKVDDWLNPTQKTL